MIGFIEKLFAKLYGVGKRSYYVQKYNDYRQKFSLDESFRFNGDAISFYGKGKIIAGKNSYIGRYSQIQAGEGLCVNIGDNVSISHFVKIYTSSHDPEQRDNILTGDVNIETGVWIGAGVFIRQGVTIGKDSVVGANSVVTKDIPAGAIAAGAPCRVIRQFSRQ